ncbi:MAG: methyl-accepting chemotaxis protein [Pseudomonadota bacterium]
MGLGPATLRKAIMARPNLTQIVFLVSAVVAGSLLAGLVTIGLSVDDIGNAAERAEGALPSTIAKQDLAQQINSLRRLSLELRSAPTGAIREKKLAEINRAVADSPVIGEVGRTLGAVQAGSARMVEIGREVDQLSAQQRVDEGLAAQIVEAATVVVVALDDETRGQLGDLAIQGGTGSAWTDSVVRSQTRRLLTVNYLHGAILSDMHLLRSTHLQFARITASLGERIDGWKEARARFLRRGEEVLRMVRELPTSQPKTELESYASQLVGLEKVFQTSHDIVERRERLRVLDSAISESLAKLAEQLAGEAASAVGALEVQAAQTVSVVNRTQRGLYAGGALSIVVLVFGIYALRQGVIAPLTQASGALEAMRAGNGGGSLKLPRFREFAEIERSIGAFDAAVSELRATSAEAARGQRAVQNASFGLAMFETDGRLKYSNPALHRMLGAGEDIQIDRTLARALDRAQTDPRFERQESVNLTLDVGRRRFATQWTSVAVDGQSAGVIAEWIDRTREMAVQAEVEHIVDAARSGDLARRIDLDGKEGVFLSLGQGINALLDVNERAIGECARVLAEMASGGLNEPMRGEYQGAFASLQSDIGEMQSVLGRVISQFIDSAVAVRAGSGEIARGNADLSERTQTQLAAFADASKQMDAMTRTVRDTAENANRANTLASDARNKAHQGGQIVGETVVAMREIDSASNRIEDIISSIDDIAFQTNLLALNAAVEAARAGEEGRGFAVVAGEVRSLAQRSASAAKLIKDLIADTLGKVAAGRDLVERSGLTLEEIVSAVDQVSTVVSDITDASDAQTRGIERVNQTLNDMKALAKTNAQYTDDVARSSAQMQDRAGQLATLTDYFRTTERRDETPFEVA